MSAPKDASLKNMTGPWTFLKSLSDSTDTLLTVQAIPWWKRQAAAIVTVTEHMTQSSSNGITRIDIEQRITGGFKGGMEWLVLDGSEQTILHENFGEINLMSRWGDLGDEDDAWLREGWLEGEEEKAGPNGEKHIKVLIEHKKVGWKLIVVWGFMEVDGQRYHGRKLLCRNGSEVAKCRAIYGWSGK